MDPEQFQSYTEGLVALDNRRILRNHKKEEIDALIRQTQICCGDSQSAIREWFDEIDLAVPILDDPASLIRVVTRTISGPLRKEVERFIRECGNHPDNPVAREAVAWNDIKSHVQTAFLSLDENAYLRDQIEEIRQSAYESPAAYNLRFRGLADAAYPRGTRNADQIRVLLRAYARGLHCAQMAKRLVTTGRPTSLEDAMHLVLQYSSADDEFNRLGRKEEPMEIGVIGRHVSSKTVSDVPKAVDDMNAIMDKMSCQMERLFTRIAKLECQSAREQREKKSGRKTKPSSWTEDGRPVCYECGNPGHFGRDCDVRRKRLAQNSGN